MAKYTGSVFGSISGQQLGVVGSVWKGINYIREYVKPSNPRTVNQTLQRTKFKNISQFGRRIVDTILNPYTVPIPKKKSAFNAFVERNVPLQEDLVLAYNLIKMSQGGLFNPGIAVPTRIDPTTISIALDSTKQGEAQDSDSCIVVVYDMDNNLFYYSSDVVRSDLAAVISMPGSNVLDGLKIWLFYVAANGSIASDSAFWEGDVA